MSAARSRQQSDRLAQAAKANATSQARGLPREEAVSAINGSIVATVFRFKLVLRIISLAQEFLDRELLVQAALGAYMALATTEGEETARASFIKPLEMRDRLFARVNEL